MRHVECINPLGVRLGVEVSSAHISPKLGLDCMGNQVSDLLHDLRARRPVILELTAFLWVQLFVERFTLDGCLLRISLSEFFVKERAGRFPLFWST